MTAEPTLASAPATQVPLDGMVLAQAVRRAESNHWQAVVCLANFGSRPASNVVISVTWSANYQLVVLLPRDGLSQVDENSADHTISTLSSGVQTQVTLLLKAPAANAVAPVIQTNLSYTDGPPRVHNARVDCQPGGIQPAAGTGITPKEAPTAAPPPTIAPAAAEASVLRVADAPLPIEPPAIGLALASWQCFILPALLFGAAAALLVLSLNRRRVA